MRLRIIVLALACACSSEAVHATLLRVMTYNIHWGGLGKDGVRDLDRIADVINAANPDIVALQEVDKNAPRSGNVDQMSVLAQLTGMQSYFGKASNSGDGAVGNGVLVRSGIDIVSTITHRLPNPDDATPNRSVVEMNLSTDGASNTTEFKFFATHLFHNSSAGRIASAHFINDLVSSSTVPSILAGDMNFNPGSTAFNVTATEWTDLTNINNSGKNRDNQIDYIFYRTEPRWDVVTRSQFIVNPLTNVASDHHPLLGVLELPDDPDVALIWNVNSGMATGLTEGFATGNGNLGVGTFPASPWANPYSTGAQQLIIGYNGNATFSGSSSRTIGSLRVGTNQANAVIAGRNGNGSMTASGSVNLTAASSTVSTGDVIVGEGGYNGVLNWDSSGTLEAQGRLRVGQGGRRHVQPVGRHCHRR
jgi:endonuclease/exonuclease/phosphatase family metal-dependent hydrolase